MSKQRKVAAPATEVDRRIPLACADENAAVQFMEEQRGWIADSDAACPKCGVLGESYRMKTTGRALRPWRCRACGSQFTVKTATVMEDSPIPVRFWCLAFYRACASKKGVSALQIQRETNLTYKSALFLMHRIRWAMAPVNENVPKLGSGGGIVEFDETYVGGNPRRIPGRETTTRGPAYDFSKRKTPVVAGVERGGRVRAVVVDSVKREILPNHVSRIVDRSAHLMTDERETYKPIGKAFASHHTVRHKSGEYVRVDPDMVATTNTIEGFFAGLKRQIRGTHHVVSKKHLHRYVTESEFKYNTRGLSDGERTVKLIREGVQKRLTYRDQVGE